VPFTDVGGTRGQAVVPETSAAAITATRTGVEVTGTGKAQYRTPDGKVYEADGAAGTIKLISGGRPGEKTEWTTDELRNEPKLQEALSKASPISTEAPAAPGAGGMQMSRFPEGVDVTRVGSRAYVDYARPEETSLLERLGAGAAELFIPGSPEERAAIQRGEAAPEGDAAPRRGLGGVLDSMRQRRAQRADEKELEKTAGAGGVPAAKTPTQGGTAAAAGASTAKGAPAAAKATGPGQSMGVQTPGETPEANAEFVETLEAKFPDVIRGAVRRAEEPTMREGAEAIRRATGAGGGVGPLNEPIQRAVDRTLLTGLARVKKGSADFDLAEKYQALEKSRTDADKARDLAARGGGEAPAFDSEAYSRGVREIADEVRRRIAKRRGDALPLEGLKFGSTVEGLGAQLESNTSNVVRVPSGREVELNPTIAAALRLRAALRQAPEVTGEFVGGAAKAPEPSNTVAMDPTMRATVEKFPSYREQEATRKRRMAESGPRSASSKPAAESRATLTSPQGAGSFMDRVKPAPKRPGPTVESERETVNQPADVKFGPDLDQGSLTTTTARPLQVVSPAKKGGLFGFLAAQKAAKAKTEEGEASNAERK